MTVDLTTAEGIEDAKGKIGLAAEAMKELGETGLIALGKTIPQLACLIAVGTTLKHIIAGTKADAMEPLMKKFGELKSEIDKLSSKMSSEFGKLKSFMTEIKFESKISDDIGVLMIYMSAMNEKGLTEKQRKTRVQNFKDKYAKYDPLEYARKLRVMNNSFNSPLNTAVEADYFKSQDAYDKWEKLFTGVFKQLLMIEAVAVGLINDGNENNYDELASEAHLYIGMMDHFRENFKNDEDFWDKKVKEFVKKTLEDNKDKPVWKKADLIQKAMERVLTNDIFVVTVSASSCPCLKHVKNSDQILVDLNHSGCRALIYRSHEAYSEATDHTFQKIRDGMQEIKKVINEKDVKSFWTTQKELDEWATDKVKDAGYLVAYRERNVGIAYTRAKTVRNSCTWLIEDKHYSDFNGIHFNSMVVVTGFM
ncbi:hypothetical protein CRE_27874 [Caenorhabditis remanei]|uniref:Uncharacterized protein n=1 Tax=Caenorhabditis remanei TaxID=31234 RepID=E3NG89_CAERE|nr:hypothetical protein CRE_27874 [Caenorhabditis remanei]